ncbi:MAG: TatD family hydrolase [Marinilabiliaceae bacterium]
MPFINFHTHICADDPDQTTAIISCVSPEPLPACPKRTWLSYGIHPWYIQGHDTSILLEKVRDTAPDPRVLAIGEAGLDKIRGPAFDIQRKIFSQQIEISEQTGKPLIIHSVKAHHEVLHMRKTLTPHQPWILHGFSGPPQEAEQLVRRGFYLSFGPKILFDGGKAQLSLRRVPDDRFFLETDHSNKSIIALYEKAAEIREISTEQLQETIKSNFYHLFDHLHGLA